LDYWKKAIKLTINVFNGLFVIDELQVSYYYYGVGVPSCNTLLVTYWLIWYRFLGNVEAT